MFTNIFDMCLFAKLNDVGYMYVDLVMDRKKPYKLMHCCGLCPRIVVVKAPDSALKVFDS